jgi:stearoyl-CoA desaturase (Delta-9 desaturase)
LPWWGYAVVALALTHITIAAVTIFLHRHQTHRGLDLHPVAGHLFRFWLWLTTGMVTKEWVAVHRKHHARCETPEDPHSPQVRGISRVLWGGVFLYVRESEDRDTLAKYGSGTPNDWIETHLYTPHPFYGVVLMAVIDLVLFGIVPGGLIFAVQMAWIPFWAAGVINGIGHYWGYRNYPVESASTNIVPWGILIGGEEFHNNHHAYPSSAKLSSKWYEFDIGWMYIRILQVLGLAQVRKTAPRPQFAPGKTLCDVDTVRAVITHRYYVLAQYTRSVTKVCRQEISRLSQAGAKPGEAILDNHLERNLLRWLRLYTWDGEAHRPIRLDAMIKKDSLLQIVYSMRQELSELWTRSSASTEQLLTQLRGWCARAESSGIPSLQEFSRRLPHLV